MGLLLIFGKVQDQWQLIRKTESTPLPGIYKLVRGQKQFVTYECRFVFLGDEAARTSYSVTSTLDQSNGQFHWMNLFRENPPRAVIFCGGCNPASTH
jgi:hypothetical protein